MAKVTILNDNVSFEVPDGARLMPYAKENSGLMFGCGKGECGICICTVVKGAENLNKRTDKEYQHLQSRGATPAQRLACQVVVNKGEVTIEY
ncbi:MAG: 2Fe-2S iron-sulfur cluster-binding protein [Candidatus Micrarchaeota archaeon]